MSVHGEYSRALEALITFTRALAPDVRADWPERLESARIGQHPDLSTAARTALDTVEGLREICANSPPIAAAEAHLRSHCGAILGKPS
jgi:hypothetical protein